MSNVVTWTDVNGNRKRGTVLDIAGDGSPGTVIWLAGGGVLVLAPSLPVCPREARYWDRFGILRHFVRPELAREKTQAERQKKMAEYTREWYRRHRTEIGLRAARKRNAKRKETEERKNGRDEIDRIDVVDSKRRKQIWR